MLESTTRVITAPNIRPTLETEHLVGAQTVLAKEYIHQSAKKLNGMENLLLWSGEGILPSATAFGRVIRFLSAMLKEKKGVLGVDLGASASVVAAALGGELSLSVFPQFGRGPYPGKLLDCMDLENISSWLTNNATEKDLREYLHDRMLYPASLPGTRMEQEIEHAVLRSILQQSILYWPALDFPLHFQWDQLDNSGLMNRSLLQEAFSRVRMVNRRTHYYCSDGLQPAGITTLILDQHQIVPAVGAAAFFNSLLAVQVMDSNAFMNLGTVIVPVSKVKSGQPVLRLKITYEGGDENEIEVRNGSLEVLPLPYGKSARIKLQPLHRADIGMGAPGRGGAMAVKGGLFGVVIDARGRPLKLPKDPQKRGELYTKWLWSLEAH